MSRWAHYYYHLSPCGWASLIFARGSHSLLVMLHKNRKKWGTNGVCSYKRAWFFACIQWKITEKYCKYFLSLPGRKLGPFRAGIMVVKKHTKKTLKKKKEGNSFSKELRNCYNITTQYVFFFSPEDLFAAARHLRGFLLRSTFTEFAFLQKNANQIYNFKNNSKFSFFVLNSFRRS